jgi:hypothetical protein
MYKQQPIFPQSEKENGKTYIHRLLGRMNRLKKMIIRRNVEVLPKYQTQIDKIELEIQKLQLKKEKWVVKKKQTLNEIGEIRNELDTYLKKVEPLLDNVDISPTLTIRELPRKLKGGIEEIYYEGRVRGRMIKGYRSKDYTFQFGTIEKVKEILKKEFNKEYDELTPYDRDKYLKIVLRRNWLEDKITTNL